MLTGTSTATDVDGGGRHGSGPCRRRLFRKVVEGMWRRSVRLPLPQLGVRQVGDGFGRGREDRRAVLPAHGSDQRNGHQGVRRPVALGTRGPT